MQNRTMRLRLAMPLLVVSLVVLGGPLLSAETTAAQEGCPQDKVPASPTLDSPIDHTPVGSEGPDRGARPLEEGPSRPKEEHTADPIGADRPGDPCSVPPTPPTCSPPTSPHRQSDQLPVDVSPGLDEVNIPRDHRPPDGSPTLPDPVRNTTDPSPGASSDRPCPATPPGCNSVELPRHDHRQAETDDRTVLPDDRAVPTLPAGDVSHSPGTRVLSAGATSSTTANDCLTAGAFGSIGAAIPANAVPVPVLAYTGAGASKLALLGGFLVFAGLLLVASGRCRRTEP